MTKVQVPILIQNPYLAYRQEHDLVEGSFVVRDAFFDGPETDRIKIVDDNPELNPSSLMAVYKSPAELGRGITTGRYYTSSGVNVLKEINKAHNEKRLDDELELIFTPEFMQMNVYGVIEKTVDFFEKPNLLGRKIQWHYPGEKLVAYVRAKKRSKLNAGYKRDDDLKKQRLRFYYKSEVTQLPDIETVFACLSRDVVVHETAHAVIDGINRSLYDFRGTSPDTLSIHEALADLTAAFVSFESSTLTKEVLGDSHGNLDQESQITYWGEIFNLVGQQDQRSFLNKWHLDDENPDENYKGNGGTYERASVFSGAIFSVFVQLFDLRKKALAVEMGPKNPLNQKGRTKKDPEFSMSGYAMLDVLRRMPLLIYRALDYLPNADVSLADFCRAILLVDHILFGSNSFTSGLLRKEFLKRKLFFTQQNAVVEWPLPPRLDESVTNLAEHKELLIKFIEENKAWLGILEDVKIDSELNCEWVMPVESPARKNYFDTPQFNTAAQGILKLHWTYIENKVINNNPLTSNAGTTVIFDVRSNKIIGRLVCAPATEKMFVSELVQTEYENEFAHYRQRVHVALSNELKAIKEEMGAVSEVDRETHIISIKNGVITVIGRGISGAHGNNTNDAHSSQG